MGWMRTLLLGDLGNHLDNLHSKRHISNLSVNQKKASQNQVLRDTQIAHLKAELGRQKLAIQALTRFLIEKEMINENELQEFINEVDAEDGVIDGQIAIEPAKRKLVFSSKKVDPSLYKKPLQ